MSNDIVKYAFIAGEISPKLYGRTDLTKYDLALAEAQNFFVDYRGGLSSRPGTEFCDFILHDDLTTRTFAFEFSSDISNTYLVLAGHNYFRFIQDGAYVLESAKTLTAMTLAAEGVFTSAAHGFTNGDWLKLAGVPEILGRTLVVSDAATNTFKLKTWPSLDYLDTSAFDAFVSGTAARVYTVVSPYTSADLAGLAVDQYRDLLRITSKSFATRDLVRSGHASWALSETDFSPDLAGPDITSASSTAPAGSQLASEVVFSVSQINLAGEESANGNLYKITNTVNYTATEGSVTITWDPEADAVSYNVYRSVVTSLGTLYEGTELGYVGNSRGTSFTDPNITPDFTKSPVVKTDPFAPGHVQRIQVTAGGSGYTEFATTVSITDPDGTGFEGQVVVGSAGDIVNVIVKNPGRGYTAPVVSFAGSGTLATATAEVAALTGTYPALSAVWQQRQVYAATENEPVTIWGSRYKRFNNFDASTLVLDNDSYEFDLDVRAIDPIRHMLPSRGGLLLFTQSNIWLLNGGGQNDPLTPTNALADPQTYNGCTTLRPLTVEQDILYREGKGFSARLLSYNDITKVYAGEDKSILANHLLGFGKDITAWCYQEAPFKTVWAVREDGTLLAFTIVKAEDVFAWTPSTTRGKFVDVINIREGATDRVYVTTQRLIGGRWTKFIERLDLRTFTNVEDAWCVDAGLKLGGTYPAGEVTIFRDGDVWSATGPSGAFSASVGKFLRAGEGIFKVTALTSPVSVNLQCFAEPTNFIPERGDTQTFPILEGSWTLDTATTTLFGLWHLEGEEVSILGDGSVFPRQIVTNGRIELDHPVSRAIIGLPFRCRARTLPLIVPNAGIEAKRRRVVGVAVRLDKSRGLKVGYSLDNLYEMRERTTEPMGTPTRLVNGVKYQLISSDWNSEGQSYFVLDDPLPVNILSLVFDMEVGDDPD